MRKKPQQQIRMDWPELFVHVGEEDNTAGERPRMCRARIKSRLVGSTVFRYLSYRDGSTVRNLYLGSCTPRTTTREAKKQ